jgi:hypothetical protein
MTRPKQRDIPGRPASGEPDAGGRGPDTWPFEVPGERRERVLPEPVREERSGERESPTANPEAER